MQPTITSPLISAPHEALSSLDTDLPPIPGLLERDLSGALRRSAVVGFLECAFFAAMALLLLVLGGSTAGMLLPGSDPCDQAIAHQTPAHPGHC